MGTPLVRSKSDFHEDKDIDERFRNKLSDFRNSGYDRGHMVGSGTADYRSHSTVWAVEMLANLCCFVLLLVVIVLLFGLTWWH